MKQRKSKGKTAIRATFDQTSAIFGHCYYTIMMYLDLNYHIYDYLSCAVDYLTKEKGPYLDWVILEQVGHQFG